MGISEVRIRFRKGPSFPRGRESLFADLPFRGLGRVIFGSLCSSRERFSHVRQIPFLNVLVQRLKAKGCDKRGERHETAA